MNVFSMAMNDFLFFESCFSSPERQEINFNMTRDRFQGPVRLVFHTSFHSNHHMWNETLSLSLKDRQKLSEKLPIQELFQEELKEVMNKKP